MPISKLAFGQNDLIDIFTKYTTSDISDAETMLQVLKLFVASRNAAIKEVHFPAELGPSYVYASPEAINEAVEQVPRDRSQRRPARIAGRELPDKKKKGKKAEEAEEASRSRTWRRRSRRAATNSSRPHEAGEAEAKSSPAR